MMGKQTGKIQMIILEGIYMSYKQINCSEDRNPSGRAYLYFGRVPLPAAFGCWIA